MGDFYGDYMYLVNSINSWSSLGGNWHTGVFAGEFVAGLHTGYIHKNHGSRLAILYYNIKMLRLFCK